MGEDERVKSSPLIPLKERFSKNGFNRQGEPRYKCKGCGGNISGNDLA